MIGARTTTGGDSPDEGGTDLAGTDLAGTDLAGTDLAGTDLVGLLAKRSIVVCCGSGGVGKTTTAAALGLLAAGTGRRACVVTIDPARRLADALGALDVANVPHRIPGPWPGELSAVMLDAKGTFDDLVRRYARDAGQAERILANRLYGNLVSVLSGTQEYMATEKLFELHEAGDFDLVVVDTPPTRNALDFLDAPRRLAGFLDNRVFRLLLTPGRAYLRAMSVATQLLLRTLAKVAGSEIVEDTIAFFQAFEGMEEGFRDRAARVERLLAEEATGFVVVAAPRRDSIDEARFFASRLAANGHGLDVVVVNRVHPDFGTREERGPGRSAGRLAGVGDGGTARSGGPPAPGSLAMPGDVDAGAWKALSANLAEMDAVVARESSYIRSLTGITGGAPVVTVPILDDDVHDISGLEGVARHLAGGELPWGGDQAGDRE
ncbi:MAG: ArsA family ATPase [Acidimicrobiales bacterium]